LKTEATLGELEEKLCEFDPAERREAVGELARRIGAPDVQSGARTRPARLVRCGEVGLPTPSSSGDTTAGNVNMHVHTFFSYNADGWSPSRIAWEARKAGLLAAGVVDFDVLDGMAEFLDAADALSLRAVVGVESRVFVKEMADKEINSPGEPGISYYMGTGFWKLPPPGGAGAGTLESMRSLARRRNEEMAGRVNAHLGAAAIDYERDVLPLAPSGNATERHMVAAYESKGVEVFPDAGERARYWAEGLGEDVARVEAIMPDGVAFRDLIRAKLMKRGGVGYAAPERGSFPALEDMVEMAASCEAVPTCTWLDGTSSGESSAQWLVDFYRSKGALALNVIPDRNWNLKDPDEKRLKTANLHEIVRAARAAGLIICSGTERNKHGLPFVDDLTVEALAPVADAIREGAFVLYGHTAMARFAGRPLAGQWAESAFGDDAAARNRFYLEVGRLLEPGPLAGDLLRDACAGGSPEEVLEALGGKP
jgi:hypothetical protein